jgi:hypothetical protein
MNHTLRRIALGPHPELALTAFTRFRRVVETGLMTEEQALQSIVASANIPETEASETITRAFDPARRKET